MVRAFATILKTVAGCARVAADTAAIAVQELASDLRRGGLFKAQRRRRRHGHALAGKQVRKRVHTQLAHAVAASIMANTSVLDTGLAPPMLQELWQAFLAACPTQAYAGKYSLQTRFISAMMMYRGQTAVRVAARIGASASAVSNWFWEISLILHPVLTKWMPVRASAAAKEAADGLNGGLFRGLAGIVDGFTVSMLCKASDGRDEGWSYDNHHGVHGINYLLVVDVHGRILDLQCIGFGGGASELACFTRYVRKLRAHGLLEEDEFFLADPLYFTSMGGFAVPGLTHTQRLAREVLEQADLTDRFSHEPHLHAELASRNDAGAALAVAGDFMEQVVASTRIVVENVIATIKAHNPRLGGRQSANLVPIKDRGFMDTLVRGTVGIVAFRLSHTEEAARSAWFCNLQRFKYTGPVSMALKAFSMTGHWRDYEGIHTLPEAFQKRRDHSEVEKLLNLVKDQQPIKDQHPAVAALKAMNTVLQAANSSFTFAVNNGGIQELRKPAVNPLRGVRAGWKRAPRRLPGQIMRYRKEFHDEETDTVVRPFLLLEPVREPNLVAVLDAEASVMDCSDVDEGTPLYQRLNSMHWLLWWYDTNGNMLFEDGDDGNGNIVERPQTVQVSDDEHWRKLTSLIELAPPSKCAALAGTPMMEHAKQVAEEWANLCSLQFVSIVGKALKAQRASTSQGGEEAQQQTAASSSASMPTLDRSD